MALKEQKESKEVVKSSPSPAISPLIGMERWFEEVFRRPFSLMLPSMSQRLALPAMEELSPTVDVFEEGDEVVVKAELPGIEKDNISVTLTGDVLMLSGEKKQEEKVEKKNYYRLERSYGSFSRSIRLPAEVQSDKAKAKFRDGVLEVRVPKTEEAKKKEKKVPIE